MDSVNFTYDQLQEQIKQLQEKAEIARKAEIDAFLAEVKPKIAKYGITAAQLGLSTDSSAPGKTLSGKKEKVVIYRNINNHKQTWSGSSRGVKPQWVKDAIGDGNLEQHRVKPDHATR